MPFSITSFVYFTGSLVILAKQNAWIPAEKPFETYLTVAPNIKERTPEDKLLGIHMRSKLLTGINERFQGLIEQRIRMGN